MGGYDSLCDSNSYRLCALHIGAKIAFPLHVLNPNHLPRFQDVPEFFGLKNKSACNCGGELNYLPAVDGLDLRILLAAWNPPPLALAVVGSGQETVGSEELAAVSSQPLAPSPRLSASSDLIDAALAWELLGSAPTEQAPSVERETGL
jgi:hypothetical protein